MLCDSAFHQSGNSLFSEDGPAEYNADAEGKQGGYPHPTCAAHHPAPHHAAAPRCSGHRSAAEEKEKHYDDDKGDDEGGLVCCVHEINLPSRVRRLIPQSGSTYLKAQKRSTAALATHTARRGPRAPSWVVMLGGLEVVMPWPGPEQDDQGRQHCQRQHCGECSQHPAIEQGLG